MSKTTPPAHAVTNSALRTQLRKLHLNTEGDRAALLKRIEAHEAKADKHPHPVKKEVHPVKEETSPPTGPSPDDVPPTEEPPAVEAESDDDKHPVKKAKKAKKDKDDSFQSAVCKHLDAGHLVARVGDLNVVYASDTEQLRSEAKATYGSLLSHFWNDVDKGAGADLILPFRVFSPIAKDASV